MFKVYVGAEGFTLRNGEFIIKELSFVYGSGPDYEHFIFEAPAGMVISPLDQQTVNYCTRNLHSLRWDEGLVPYSALHSILISISNCHIICHGCTTYNKIKKMLPNAKITDTSAIGNVLPASIANRSCGRRHGPSRGRHCALAKAIYIRENFVIEE